MTALWNTSGEVKPTTATVYPTFGSRIINGVDTAVTRYYGSSDPSSGASWGASEVGVEWVDSTNEINGAGDDLGAVVKVWCVLTTAPTYGWLTRNLRAYIPEEPNSNVLNLANQSTTAFTDLDLNTATDGRAIAVRLLVTIEDSGTPAAAVFADFRKNGTTTDARARRVYPQVTDIPVCQIIEVELDSTQIMEYAIDASGASAFDLRIDLLGYYTRAQ